MNIKSLFATARADHIVRHKGFRFGRKDAPVDPEMVKNAIAEALTKRDAEIRELIEKIKSESAAGTEAANAKVKQLQAELEAKAAEGVELSEKFAQLEQEFAAMKAGNRPGNGAKASIGHQFSETDDFKELAAKGRGTALMRLKAVTYVDSSASGTSTGSAGDAIIPDYLPGIITPLLRKLTIRDLIMPGRTGSNTVSYVKETGFQNMAAAVAEGALKPQSDINLTRVDTSVKTLAHWLKATKQILADVPMLETYIDTRLRYGLKYVEEQQLLSGDGTGENLLGLIPQATAFNNTLRVTGDTNIDTIRRAIVQARIAEYVPNGLVLNPVDWAAIELTKDANNRYIYINVVNGGPPTLWRLPVVETNSMPAGDFLVGAFDMAAQVFDREDANVQVSTEDQDNFVKNMVTIRAEERLALAVYRPEALIYGSFVAPT